MKKHPPVPFVTFREAGLSSEPFGQSSTPAELVERGRVAEQGRPLANASPEDWARYHHARKMRGRKRGATMTSVEQRRAAAYQWHLENPDGSAADWMRAHGAISLATAKRDLRDSAAASSAPGST